MLLGNPSSYEYDICPITKVESKLDLGIFSELSFPKQEMMFNKLALIDEIEREFITNEEKNGLN
ncbi:hypothetical protein [Bacillus cereus]|uniref:hypothetical protein n=1 Tax=Bacillus cereus TaxID=1396 RepID=UPI001E4241DA|nr:hypothetical protein [Bacillus cereus]